MQPAGLGSFGTRSAVLAAHSFSNAAMQLFNLPTELTQQIFEELIWSRDFKRVMRLRLVNSK